MKILYTNVQSVFNKLNELAAYATEVQPDFILLTETWCNQDMTNAALTIPNYQLEIDLRRDREDTTQGIGGGLLVYTRLGIKISPCDSFKNIDFNQYCAFTVPSKIRTENVTIVLIYRPPNRNKENLENLIQIVKNLPKNSILIGDINLPHIDWQSGKTDSRGASFYNAVVEQELEQLVSFPTHNKGNILDLLVTNMCNNIISVSGEPPIGRSDHCVLLAEVLMPKMPQKNKSKVSNWAKADLVSLKNHIKQENWAEIWNKTGSHCTVEDAWTSFKKKLSNATQLFVPVSTIKPQSSPRWLTRDLIKLIRRKKRAWRTFRIHGTAENRNRYEELNREVTKKIRNAKRGMEKKLANSTARGNNTRKFASYIKSKTKSVTTIGPIKKDGTLLSDDLEMAEELNKFFSSVFTQENIQTVPHKQRETPKSINKILITKERVVNKPQNLDENLAPGPDGITAKILKLTASTIAGPLCEIFNRSLSSGIVPSDWKIARVTPIYKKGPKPKRGPWQLQTGISNKYSLPRA